MPVSAEYDQRPIIPPCTGYCRGSRERLGEAAAIFQQNSLDLSGPPLYCKCCDAYLIWAPTIEQVEIDPVTHTNVAQPGALEQWYASVPKGMDPNDANPAVERNVARCFHCQYDVRYFGLKPKRKTGLIV
jgi:hypothetical protein